VAWNRTLGWNYDQENLLRDIINKGIRDKGIIKGYIKDY
jgi:hypothetical protein